MLHAMEFFPNQRMIFGDLDEFPSAQQLGNLKQSELNKDLTVYSIEAPTYYRYLNLAQSDGKSMTSSISFDCRNPPDIDSIRSSSHKPVDGESGAHLSYLGMTSKKMTKKLSSFSHTELQGFDEIEMSILSLADRYQVDHLGRFFNPSRGLMRLLRKDELPSTNKSIFHLRSKDFLESKTPNYFSRITASAIITFLRDKWRSSSAIYEVIFKKMTSKGVSKISDLGPLALFAVLFLQLLELLKRWIKVKLKKLVA
jgi:hypothetical protein